MLIQTYEIVILKHEVEEVVMIVDTLRCIRYTIINSIEISPRSRLCGNRKTTYSKGIRSESSKIKNPKIIKNHRTKK